MQYLLGSCSLSLSLSLWRVDVHSSLSVSRSMMVAIDDTWTRAHWLRVTLITSWLSSLPPKQKSNQINKKYNNNTTVLFFSSVQPTIEQAVWINSSGHKVPNLGATFFYVRALRWVCSSVCLHLTTLHLLMSRNVWLKICELDSNIESRGRRVRHTH